MISFNQFLLHCIAPRGIQEEEFKIKNIWMKKAKVNDNNMSLSLF